MVVTSEFHIIVLKNDDSTFSPVYGRVYDEDCEYDETTEGKEGEMEVEDDDDDDDDKKEEDNPSRPDQPINPNQRIGGKSDSGGITNAIPKTESPILEIKRSKITFSYYEIKGNDVKKRVMAGSLSASSGSTEVLDSKKQKPLNKSSRQSTRNSY